MDRFDYPPPLHAMAFRPEYFERRQFTPRQVRPSIWILRARGPLSNSAPGFQLGYWVFLGFIGPGGAAPRDFVVVVDLDLDVYSLKIDGELVLSNKPFSETVGFPSNILLSIGWGLTGFGDAVVIDDFEVRHIQ